MSPTVHKESLFHLSLVEQSYSDIPHVPELSSLRLSVSNAVWGIGSNSENESEVQSDICRLLPQCLCHRRTCISNQPDTIVSQRFCSKVSVYGFFPPLETCRIFKGQLDAFSGKESQLGYLPSQNAFSTPGASLVSMQALWDKHSQSLHVMPLQWTCPKAGWTWTNNTDLNRILNRMFSLKCTKTNVQHP